MTYKAVFSDIDGTLLNTHYELSPPTSAAIRKLHNNGTPFVLVSARSPKCIYPIQEEIGINGPIIAYGGALILDGSRNPVYDLGIGITRAVELKQYMHTRWPLVTITTYFFDAWYVDDADDLRIVSEASNTGAVPLAVSLPGLADTVPEVHKIFCMGNPDDIAEMAEVLTPLNSDLLVIRSSPTLLEVMHGQVSKSDAVKRVTDALGVSLSETVAIGDNYNDIDMLECAGLGIAMGNSPQPVKERADRVTADCNNDGVLLALESLTFS